MSVLADRIRGIVGPRNTGTPLPPADVVGAVPRGGLSARGHAGSDLATTLGGEWQNGCFVVEDRWEPDARHGREAVGALAGQLHDARDQARLLAGGAAACPPFLFFDLETTGLSGGAGTYAFLVGCGWFDADHAFVTRQFLLTRFSDERPLLASVATEFSRAGALVSFNGKSFDAPVLETRYAFHRLAWIGAAMPHIDALHPARRFWGRHRGPERAALHEQADCSLTALERRLLGSRRIGDVDGFEIPARYFQFVRSGDAGPLAAVLEHNRLDLLTLAALTARLLHLARIGPAAARDAREAFALGIMYARAGLDEQARASFACAIERSRAPAGAFDPVRIDSLRALAIAWRRARQHDEAAACWRRLLDTRGCPAPIVREASQALAVHHEHRVRDLPAAKQFALKSLENELPPAWTQAVQHRLARLERKMEGLKFEL